MVQVGDGDLGLNWLQKVVQARLDTRKGMRRGQDAKMLKEVAAALILNGLHLLKAGGLIEFGVARTVDGIALIILQRALVPGLGLAQLLIEAGLLGPAPDQDTELLNGEETNVRWQPIRLPESLCILQQLLVAHGLDLCGRVVHLRGLVILRETVYVACGRATTFRSVLRHFNFFLICLWPIRKN